MYELSQDDLAQALEMSRLTIRNWKMVKMLPRYFIKVVNHFDMLELVYKPLTVIFLIITLTLYINLWLLTLIDVLLFLESKSEN
jgi:DNA-binding XRE family transcriptional regulator